MSGVSSSSAIFINVRAIIVLFYVKLFRSLEIHTCTVVVNVPSHSCVRGESTLDNIVKILRVIMYKGLFYLSR